MALKGACVLAVIIYAIDSWARSVLNKNLPAHG